MLKIYLICQILWTTFLIYYIFFLTIYSVCIWTEIGMHLEYNQQLCNKNIAYKYANCDRYKKNVSI